MKSRKYAIGATFALIVSIAVLFGPVIRELVRDWSNDDNYSHGFFIVPLALYFVWERRQRLKATAITGSFWGLILVAGSIAALIAGVIGAELFLTRVALIGVVAGAILFVCGWQVLRICFFPLAFLFLMIPVPAIIFNKVALPLQLLASRVGEFALDAYGVPVLREGNVITLAHTTLEVAEACSGIRSLISLVTLGLVYGYFMDPRTTVRTALTVATVPIAIATNALRVAGTAIAAHHFGAETAEGFLHTFSGWLVFLVALGMLFACGQVIAWLAPARGGAERAAGRGVFEERVA